MPPKEKGQVDLSIGGHGWVNFSLDGHYAWCHTPDVFDAIGVGEAQVPVQAAAHVVAIEQVGAMARREQAFFEQVRNCRLSGAGRRCPLPHLAGHVPARDRTPAG